MAAKQPSKEAVALTEKKMDMSLDDIVRMSKTNAGKNNQQRVSNKSRGVFNGNQDRSLKVRQYMNFKSTLKQGVAPRRSNFQGRSIPLSAEPSRRTVVATFHSRPINNRNAGNWNKPRLGGQPKYQGNAFSGGNALKQQQRQKQHQHQHPLPRGEMIPNQKPKTLDSLFANMKQQRMRTFNRPNNDGYARPNNGGYARPNNGGNARPNNSSNARVGFAYNQPRQPWLRGRFGSYNN